MRLSLLYFFFILCFSKTFAQLEVTTGYAVNKNLADGPSFNFGYDFKLKNRLYTKSQIGYKYLYHFNDFVGATIKVSILEFHQTLSYEIVNKKKYIFKPNLGFNYRFYSWKGKMKPPYNTLPQRVWQVEFRDDRLRLNSFSPTTPNDGNYTDDYQVANLGFSFQLQNQFRLKKNLWLHVTPFLEPDYDSSQQTGGCYIGLIFKNLR